MPFTIQGAYYCLWDYPPVSAADRVNFAALSHRLSSEERATILNAETSGYLDRLACAAMEDRALPGLALAVTSREGWWKVPPMACFPEITVHYLPNRTSGLPRGTDIARRGLYETWALSDFHATEPPGEYFRYSNIGYKTLGFLLEQVTGQRYQDLIRARALRPLGMTQKLLAITMETRGKTATGYTSIYGDRPEHSSHPLVAAVWAPYATGDGAQISTVGGMAAYLRMLLNRGQGPSGCILSEESFELMTGNGVWAGGDYYSYGLASYSVEGRKYIGHGGGNAGFKSAMVVDLEAGLGVVLLANRMGDTDPMVEVAQHALTATCAGMEGRDLLPLQANYPTRVPDAGTISTSTTPSQVAFSRSRGRQAAPAISGGVRVSREAHLRQLRRPPSRLLAGPDGVLPRWRGCGRDIPRKRMARSRGPREIIAPQLSGGMDALCGPLSRQEP